MHCEYCRQEHERREEIDRQWALYDAYWFSSPLYV